MKELGTYLAIIFMVMIWILRIMVAVTNTIGIDLGISVMNYGVEVALLFITILSMVLVFKRKILGGIIYVLTYGYYFGVALFKSVITLTGGETISDTNFYMDIFINAICMIVPIFVLIDLLLDKNRKLHPTDKKTDWFYKNEQFDREVDERSDKNNYRTM